jgi:hypothetical protein
LATVEKALFIGEIDSWDSSALDRPKVFTTEFQFIPCGLLGGSDPAEQFLGLVEPEIEHFRRLATGKATFPISLDDHHLPGSPNRVSSVQAQQRFPRIRKLE